MMFNIIQVVLATVIAIRGVSGIVISDPNPRVGNVEFMGQLCFNTGTSAEIKVVSERLKAKVGQRIFLFNSEILDTFFADGQGGNCAFAATQSLNFTLNGAEYAYLDVSSGGNCEGSCSINVQINDVPNIQFIIAQCSNVPEKVDLAFRITSSDAVSCSTASYALSSLPWIVGVCAMVVLDVAMLGVTFLLYRRKVQLEELKI